MSQTPQPVTCRPSHCPMVFGFSRATLYRWAKAGHIKIYKKGSMSFVIVEEVRSYIEQSVG